MWDFDENISCVISKWVILLVAKSGLEGIIVFNALRSLIKPSKYDVSYFVNKTLNLVKEFILYNFFALKKRIRLQVLFYYAKKKHRKTIKLTGTLTTTPLVINNPLVHNFFV